MYYTITVKQKAQRLFDEFSYSFNTYIYIYIYIYIHIYIYTYIALSIPFPFLFLYPALIIAFSINIFPNILAPKVLNNVPKNPPFCHLVSFLIVLVTPLN